jgi:hypothetical protein
MDGLDTLGGTDFVGYVMQAKMIIDMYIKLT